MKNWENYKNHVKNVDPQTGREIREIEEAAKIIAQIIKRRNDMGISQRELASLCGLPQSSIARIENGTNIPNLQTLLRILNALNLELRTFAVNEERYMESGG